MGEVADAVALDVQVELPAHHSRLLLGVCVQLQAAHAALLPTGLDHVEERPGGSAGDHLRVVAGGEGFPGVAFVALPHGAHVDEEDVVLAQHLVFLGALAKGLQGVGAETHQQWVPDALGVEVFEHLLAQRPRFGFTHAGLDLRGQGADGVPGLGLGMAHRIDAGSVMRRYDALARIRLPWCSPGLG